MNQLFDEAFDRFRRGEIDVSGLRRYTADLILLKRQTLDLFPHVFGRNFKEWYDVLSELDAQLDAAFIRIDRFNTESDPFSREVYGDAALQSLAAAKKMKQRAESLLPRSQGR